MDAHDGPRAAAEWVTALPPNAKRHPEVLNGLRLQCPRLASVRVASGGALRTLAAVSSLSTLTALHVSSPSTP